MVRDKRGRQLIHFKQDGRCRPLYIGSESALYRLHTDLHQIRVGIADGVAECARVAVPVPKVIFFLPRALANGAESQ